MSDFDTITTGTAVVGKDGADGWLDVKDASGNVTVRLDGAEGDVKLMGADCAERFDVAGLPGTDGDVAPGTVMVIDDSGGLRPCDRPYDRRAAGVVSGAGGYRPGVILDDVDTGRPRVAIALVGKAFCKVDATRDAVRVGDLLTTSADGHAMKATDPLRAFGAIIGKALAPLPDGRGLVPILVTLQ